MIETINKLINILAGTSEYEINYLLNINSLKQSYSLFVGDRLEELSGYFYEFDSGFNMVEFLKSFDFRLFLQWVFSSPDVIISFVFYLMLAWGVFYFCLVVPYRLIKQILPKAIRSGKQ